MAVPAARSLGVATCPETSPLHVARVKGELHDHRWPIAVLPLDLAGDRDVPLSEMPWQSRDGAHGVLIARSGQPWAIEDCRDVLHAVRSR